MCAQARALRPGGCPHAHKKARCAGWRWRGFSSVQPDRPHLQHAHLARKQKNLNEQLLDISKKPPPERSDRVVVRMVVGRDEAKRHRIISRPLQLAARKHPRRITINQNAQQHSGMIRRRARAAIVAAHRAKVEPVDHFHSEPRQVLLWQSLVNRRRKQKPRLPINRAEIAHARARSEMRINL